MTARHPADIAAMILLIAVLVSTCDWLLGLVS
jgi:hypothetical protein